MSDRERVLEAANLKDLVAAHTKLRRRGDRWVGLCPFHPERNASLYVDPRKGLWHCFSCKRGGDTFSWVMESEGMDFREALEHLAERYGVELEGRQGPDTRPLLKTLADLSAWLGKVLASPAGEPARAHLEERGFDPETMRGYGVGAFPPEGGLAHWAEKAGVPAADMRALGLVLPGRRGDYEPFAGRLAFAIRDPLGRVRGFAGRALAEGQEPKYRNSSDNDVFEKRALLYNLDRARKAEGPLVLVEGYTDVLRFEALGIPGAVAAMGTALGESQAALMRRHNERVVVVMDADEAGQAAADRTLGVLLGAGLECSVVTPPAGQDPDDWLREEGTGAWSSALEDAEEALGFRMRRIAQAQGGVPLSGPAAQRALVAAREILEPIPAGVLRDKAVEAASDALALPVASVVRALAAPPAAAVEETAATAAGEEAAEERELARYLLKNPRRGATVARILEAHGSRPLADAFAEGVVAGLADGGDPETVLAGLGGEAAGLAAAALLGEEARAYPEDEGEELLGAVLLRRLKADARALRASMKAGGASLSEVDAVQERLRAMAEEGVPGWDDL